MTKKLELPNVTLCCVETREHVLARMALQDCKAQGQFRRCLDHDRQAGII